MIETVQLQAKAALLEQMAEALRLYRGFCMQFDIGYANSSLFAPLAAYDTLFADQPRNKPLEWHPDADEHTKLTLDIANSLKHYALLYPSLNGFDVVAILA